MNSDKTIFRHTINDYRHAVCKSVLCKNGMDEHHRRVIMDQTGKTIDKSCREICSGNRDWYFCYISNIKHDISNRVDDIAECALSSKYYSTLFFRCIGSDRYGVKIFDIADRSEYIVKTFAL